MENKGLQDKLKNSFKHMNKDHTSIPACRLTEELEHDLKPESPLPILLKAVFFVGVALWGSNMVRTLKSFHGSVICCGDKCS